jgi:folate-dependent phosphoribosylglycinamide formyltransferase PurN
MKVPHYRRMRTLLICHEEDELNRVGLASWLASFSTLTGVVALRETSARKRKRIRREMKRVGWPRFLDVLTFRVYYQFFLASKDRAWEQQEVARLCAKYSKPKAAELVAASPNDRAAETFIREAKPDLVIARCKTLIAERVFTIPSVGTFVMHPGISPQYRNAHGCFWAMATGDVENLGMTLLKIDKGVDTGPIYGFFHAKPRQDESHIVLQHRTVFDNLDAIREKLEQIAAAEAVPVDTTGRPSAEWGQPWMSYYSAWKRVLRSLA